MHHCGVESVGVEKEGAFRPRRPKCTLRPTIQTPKPEKIEPKEPSIPRPQ
jgi:hypothetical protein